MSLEAALKELRQNSAYLPLASQVSTEEKSSNVENRLEPVRCKSSQEFPCEDAEFEENFLDNADCVETVLSGVVWSTVNDEEDTTPTTLQEGHCAGAVTREDRARASRPPTVTGVSRPSGVRPVLHPFSVGETTSAPPPSSEPPPHRHHPTVHQPPPARVSPPTEKGEFGSRGVSGDKEQDCGVGTDGYLDDIGDCLDNFAGCLDGIDCFGDIDSCFENFDNCFEGIDGDLDGFGCFDDEICGSPRNSPVTASLVKASAPTPTLNKPTHVARTEQKENGRYVTPVKRRFPGPAGALSEMQSSPAEYKCERSTHKSQLLPPQTPRSVTTTSGKKRSQQPSSQSADQSVWKSKAWIRLESGKTTCLFPGLQTPSSHQYTISKVLAQAGKTGAGLKVPMLAVLVKSVQLTRRNASIHFRDPTGEMRGTVQAEVLERLAGDSLQPGSTMLIRHASVLSPSPRRHYLSITLSNVVSIYGPEGQLLLTQTFPCGSNHGNQPSGSHCQSQHTPT